ncbi:hypothetical protein HY78_01120 [Rhizorhabdus wittichii DC-6]|nr:hypothetical protein HY78_01120 [Rhizorhabdus wittichii DC-6]
MTECICETCGYWQRRGPAIATAQVDPGCAQDIGACCRFPPTLIGHGEYWDTPVFPQTHASRTCGDWSPSFDPSGGGEQEPKPADNVISFDRSVA